MAGDWIKFELGTSDKPEVWDIAQRLEIDPDAVVGKLLRVWTWFDQHTETGNAPTVTKLLLDRAVGVTGFCDSVIAAGWMLDDGSSVSLPNFERHNGKTAKNRAVTAKRVASFKEKQRQGNDEGNDEGNGASVTSALPKEEKRREEKRKEEKTKELKPYVSGETVCDLFEDFWGDVREQYARIGDSPGAKLQAKVEFQKLKPSPELINTMKRALRHQADARMVCIQAGQFSPQFQNACRWIKNRRWEDDVVSIVQFQVPNKQQALEQRNAAVAEEWARNKLARSVEQ